MYYMKELCVKLVTYQKENRKFSKQNVQCSLHLVSLGYSLMPGWCETDKEAFAFLGCYAALIGTN